MKTNRKLIYIVLIPLLVSGCTNHNGSSSQVEKNFIEATAPFYTDVINEYSESVKQKVTDFEYGYWDTTPLVLYMTFDTALNYLFNNEVIVAWNNDVVTYTCPDDLAFVVDINRNTILAHNYDEINLFSKKYDSKFGLIDEETTTAYTKDNNSAYIGGEDVTFDLNTYSMEIYKVNDKAYVPYNVVNTLTFNYALWSSVNFNGEGFYFLDMLSGAIGLRYNNSPYMRDFYFGPYSTTSARRRSYFVEHNYNSFMFQLDHFYGFRDEKMVPFNTYLTANYPEVVDQLKSDNETDYCRGVERIMEEIIGDGHTNTDNASSAFYRGKYTTGNYTSERSSKLSSDYYQCYMKRNRELGVNATGLRYYDNTAILSFDGFSHLGVQFTKDNIASYSKRDGFALFYDAFEQINSKTNINNVIFDITCNGGGDTNALIPMLAFLSETVDMTMYSPLTKLTAKLSYKVDTNLDGVYDENDNYQDKYNFYVLTSNYSFSCANLFPQTCKEMGIAKIIGQQSGGGACVVYYSATPDGKPYRISSNMRDGDPNNPSRHNDSGIPVDYNIGFENFYNDEYLVNFINNLSE